MFNWSNPESHFSSPKRLALRRVLPRLRRRTPTTLERRRSARRRPQRKRARSWAFSMNRSGLWRNFFISAFCRKKWFWRKRQINYFLSAWEEKALCLGFEPLNGILSSLGAQNIIEWPYLMSSCSGGRCDTSATTWSECVSSANWFGKGSRGSESL